jgi:DNA-directed RNA polymerase beta' subunit
MICIILGYELKSMSPSNFFIEVLNVMANRFRPENKVNGQTFLHGHTVAYNRILEINNELRTMITKLNQGETKDNLKRIFKLETVFQKWLELQDCVVGLFNSEKA